jgi:Carboxypeptidase regulatory-like domain/TonB dependent receptor
VKVQDYLCQTAVAVMLVVLFARPTLAQLGTATLTGRVTDTSGAVIASAKIVATNISTNVGYPTDTDSDGLFSLRSLPPGTYRISVEKTGFQSLVREPVELTVAANVALNFQLPLGSVQQTVTVNTGEPLVDTQTTSLGGLINDREITNLPLNGRNYIDLTIMQPGVVSADIHVSGGVFSGTWFSSNGAPIRSNNFLLDGAIMQDLDYGSTSNWAGRTLGLDGIQEYRVLTNSIPAEYGLNMGSQTVMVSKSGTNQFHGTLFEYLRNSVLDAANYFDVPVAANDFERLPPYKRNNFGAAFGGPIRKDKTFFFANYEGVRERLGVTTIDTVPGAGCHGPAGAVITNTACPQLGSVSSVTIASAVAPFLALYPNPTPSLPNNQVTIPYTQPDSDNFGQVRVDQVFSVNDRLFGRYTIDDDSVTEANTFPEYFFSPLLTRHQYITVGETHVFSASTLNDFSLSFSRTATGELSPTPSDISGPQYEMVPGQKMGLFTVGGLTNFGLNYAALVKTQNIVGLSDNVSYIHKTHSLQFGTSFNQFRQYFLNGSQAPGHATFADLAQFLAGNTVSIQGITPGSILDRTWLFYTLGVYGEDSWRIRPNFTLNAGLRYEPALDYFHELHGLSSSLRNPSTDSSFTLGPFFLNPTYHNFSPRLGFAWDVFGDGKTAVRAGTALLYDLANIFVGTGNGAQPPFSFKNSVSGVPFTIPVSFTGAVNSNAPITLEYHLKQSQLYTWNLTVEQQVLSSMALSLSYVGSRGVHLMGEEEANPNVPAPCPTGISCYYGMYWPANAVRVNPAFSTVTELASDFDSNYNALEVSLTKHMSKGLQFQSSYTWSKLLDNGQGQTLNDCATASPVKVDPYSSTYDRGPSCFEVPQLWVFNYIYNLPSSDVGGKLLGFLARGWSTSGILKVRDGFPFTPGLVALRSQSGVLGGSTGTGGAIDRPSWNPAFQGSVITGNVAQWFNPAAFILQPAGTLGDVGRNSLLGPGFVNLDMSLQKDTKAPFLGEAGNVSFRVEAFNILNHPQFPGLTTTARNVFAGTPTDVTETPLSTAGEITTTYPYTSRQLEFSLRLSF